MTKESTAPVLWLKNGIAALAIAGLYSIILVVLRTPQLSHFFTDQSAFKSALIIHVNLSVLVWLLAITCVIWSYSNFKTGFESLFARTAFLSMLIMALSPLYPESKAVMNNYIPMLENILFIVGLSLFGAVVLLLATQTFFSSFKGKISDYGNRVIAIVNFTSSFMFICVWVCFYLSFIDLDVLSDIVPLDIDFYYEMLFWSGGHLLQFIYTQILMLVLLILVEIMNGGRVKYSSIYEMLFALNFVLSLGVFFGHYKYGISDGYFKEFYTLHMIYTAGLVPTIFIGFLLLETIFLKKLLSPAFVIISFISSVLLFLSGGLIGAIISGVNVTIPAHYHGSIVGISVAFMGFSYLFCFKKSILACINKRGGVVCNLNLDDLSSNVAESNIKLPSIQIILLTLGQILHVSGLAMAGGYGVLRKTPGAQIPLSAKVYMVMVGGGGLIAIIGGLIFVYICAKNLRK